MKVKRSQYSPNFMLKKVEISPGTIYEIYDKMSQIEDKIIKLEPSNGVVKTFPADANQITKICFYLENVIQRKNIFGQISQKLVRTLKKEINVPRNIEYNELHKQVLSMIS